MSVGARFPQEGGDDASGGDGSTQIAASQSAAIGSTASQATVATKSSVYSSGIDPWSTVTPIVPSSHSSAVASSTSEGAESARTSPPPATGSVAQPTKSAGGSANTKSSKSQGVISISVGNGPVASNIPTASPTGDGSGSRPTSVPSETNPKMGSTVASYTSLPSQHPKPISSLTVSGTKATKTYTAVKTNTMAHPSGSQPKPSAGTSPSDKPYPSKGEPGHSSAHNPWSYHHHRHHEHHEHQTHRDKA
jgi:hypothetical protein